jgi:hypothetical protein
MEIPPYPDSRPLTLQDKPAIDELFSALQPTVSEFTFANLYLFRHAHDYALSLNGDSLVVFGKGYDNSRYVLPPFGGDALHAATSILADGHPLYGADDAFAAGLAGFNGLAITEDRDSFDYLYLRTELAELPGNRFHKKKNRVQYFTSRHNHTVSLLGPEHQQGCLDLLDAWRRVRMALPVSRSLELEMDATVEAVQNMESLQLTGVVVLVEGVVKAFAIGERLNSSTAVCHFEKADPFLEGAAQLVNREFSRLLFVDCTYSNREQDLGEPGLREAKLSYHPVELIRKYRITPLP